jgi:hypothetical protein
MGAPDCGPDGRPMNWLDHFKGTPFFEQAIALEQEELQAQMASQQANSVEQQNSQQRWGGMEQIRLKKRLLELQKARNEAQVLSGGGGPPNQTGSGAGSEAQGAGALGPVAPEGQQEGSGDAQKMASTKSAAYSALKTIGRHGAIVGGAVGGISALSANHKPEPGSASFAKRHPRTNAAIRGGTTGSIIGMAGATLGTRPGRLGAEVSHLANKLKTKGKAAVTHAKDTVKAKTLHGEGKKKADEAADKMLGMMKTKTKKAEAIEGADAWGRMMAHADMAKVARAREVLEIGETAGRVMTKMGGFLETAGTWALKHPRETGAAIGGVAGAAHGLMKQDGGVGSAIGEGLAGGAAGYAGGGVIGEMNKGHSLGNAAMRTFAHGKKDVMKLSDKLKGSLGPAKPAQPPEASLGGPQVQGPG